LVKTNEEQEEQASIVFLIALKDLVQIIIQKMNQEIFDKIVERRLDKVRELLIVKGAEYVRNGDKLHNFKRAADMRRTHPIEALQGMLDKHLVSWLDIVDDLSNGQNCHFSENHLDEKLGDIVTYFVLAECLVRERLGYYPKGDGVNYNGPLMCTEVKP